MSLFTLPTDLLTYMARRIRDNEYEFPQGRAISGAAQQLIQQILTPDPSQRPTLHEIVDHEFFVRGPVPAYIPTSAHDSPPDFCHISRAASDANLRRLKRYSLLDIDYSQLPPTTCTSISPTLAPAVNARNTSPATNSKNITVTIAQQEKEFQKAVQPGSPISALLSSARQPLLMTNPGVGGNGHVRESPLLRKLQAVKESPLGGRTVTRALDGTIEEKLTTRRRQGIPSSSQGEGEYEEEELRLRKKELEAQKARIVAQMAPVREEVEDENEQGQREGYAPVVPAKDRDVIGKGRHEGTLADRENADRPTTVSAGKYGSLRTKALLPQTQPLQQSTSSRGGMVDKENMRATGSVTLLWKD